MCQKLLDNVDIILRKCVKMSKTDLFKKINYSHQLRFAFFACPLLGGNLSKARQIIFLYANERFPLLLTSIKRLFYKAVIYFLSDIYRRLLFQMHHFYLILLFLLHYLFFRFYHVFFVFFCSYRFSFCKSFFYLRLDYVNF